MRTLKTWSSPGMRFAFILIFGFFAAWCSARIALTPPHLGFEFEPSMVVQSSAGQLILEELDLIAEPGEIIDNSELWRFYSRQETLVEIMNERSITVVHGDKTYVLESRETVLKDLPSLFWIQIIVGLGSLAISGWIWSLRSRDLSSGLFALGGLSVLISAFPSAIYTTRELAIPSFTFRILEELNALGAIFFGIAILALFLVYPKKVRAWKTWVLAETVFFGVWVTLFVLKLTPEWANISVIILTAMLLICVAIGVQFWITSSDPKARASLTWLGLSVIFGAGAFVIFNTVPVILGLTPLNQGYAFLSFLIIYLGLAAGLTQFRLFEVGQWAFRLLFYAAGATVMILLDAGLVYVLGMERLPALGLALLAVGFLYLPLRDAIWRIFSGKARMETHEYLEEALDIAFAPAEQLRAARWESLLKKLFDPLEIVPIDKVVERVTIEDNGLTLLIPSTAGVSSLKLSYPWAGRSLYSPQSRELAQQIVSLIQQAESSRQAYDRGVAVERRRMAQDLHDDVGARLLTGLYIADEKLRPTLQGVLSDIRSIVSGISGEKVSLEKLLADLRYETSRRLESARIELEWPVQDSKEEKSLLDYRQHKALGSAVREVISNVIRHSEATKVRVLIESQGELLKILIQDNGKGFPDKALQGQSSGYGLKSITRRLVDIGGTLELEAKDSGSYVLLSLPYEMPLNTP